MKVLHVINWLSIGGSQNLMVNHVARLSCIAPEIENHVCVLGSRADASDEYLTRLPVAPVFLDLPSDYRRPGNALRYIAALRGVLGRLRPDIVHSYLWTSDVFSTLAGVGFGARRVAHVLDRRGKPGQPRVRFTSWLLRTVDARFAAVSEACRTHALEGYGMAPDTIVTAYNGIDTDAFAPSPIPSFCDGRAHFGTISRLAEEKGQIYLVEAFALLAKCAPNARLTIAGEGHGLGALRAEVVRRGLADRIDVPGRVSSAAGFYQSLDVFVVPSVDVEGLPTTILEAMASGLPVIATDVGGAAEAVRHSIDGLIVRVRDPKALADAMAELLAEPQSARAMGASARARVRSQFTIDAMTRRIVREIYQPIMSDRVLQLSGA